MRLTFTFVYSSWWIAHQVRTFMSSWLRYPRYRDDLLGTTFASLAFDHSNCDPSATSSFINLSQHSRVIPSLFMD